MEELAALMVGIHGRGTYRLVPFPRDRQAIDIGDYFADFDKIQHDLGWRPATLLEEGLLKTFQYYYQNIAHYR